MCKNEAYAESVPADTPGGFALSCSIAQDDGQGNFDRSTKILSTFADHQ
ncbi:hypothetical protein RMSM_07531 [Rhodopirellula maiorica SM1]|uniref:Uncharacterized protein n=1 Tax=Rhodopirellula maiorica SM1 TaxID=1265738 RepID=M5RNI5_9BACT|nr:hypothetical protein [Rhodopirellula maiorica]EMI15544.1 hypothetical protein RMSM_07531 [Rhodopirellula maiorica SM1]